MSEDASGPESSETPSRLVSDGAQPARHRSLELHARGARGER
jgi:hypothetical protein